MALQIANRKAGRLVFNCPGGGKRQGEGSISRSELGVLSSRRTDDANRRTFQACFYGRTHAGTECIIHAVR